ncbi:MAG: ABC transporter permease [Anaerolineae bacterium]|nr:ABC transporter permease [Anaerolineae bacterium]
MLRELWRSNAGKAGIILLALLLIGSVYVLLTYPLDFGTRLWSNPAAWADNPKAAPPAWTNLFRQEPRVEHRVFQAREPEVIETAAGPVSTYRFPLAYPYAEPPTFLAITLGEVTYARRPPLISVSLRRPDGRTVRLYRHVPPAPRPGEEPPFRRYHETPLRVQLSTEAATIAAVREFLEAEFGVQVSERELLEQADRALFGAPVEEDAGLRFVPLRGEYEVVVQVSFADEGDRLGLVRFVVGGAVFGLMGTDAIGRDLAQGLLFGLPVALVIGLAAATLSTAVGASLGMLSGYAGGRTDLLIQRLADIVSNVPLLPLLIFLLFIIGPHLFLVIFILVAFSWPGLTILVRSMVLGMRSGQLLEAIQSLGASRRRILFRHILPQIAPYVLAQLIFTVPSAILAEAGISFLGLGDPSIPTWGQILEHGFRTGGVYVGYWWWVVPPGLLIALTGLAFMLLAQGLEPVINPRLRRGP